MQTTTYTVGSDAPRLATDADHPPGVRVFTARLHRVRRRARVVLRDQPSPPPPEPVRRPARVAQMLARAHRIEAAIDRGEYRDRADAARRLGLTRARVSQLAKLTLLAPDIPEQILDLEAVDGQEPLSERALREVVRHEGWAEQRVEWRREHARLGHVRVLDSCGGDSTTSSYPFRDS